MALTVPAGIERIAGNRRLQDAIVALCFLAISLVFLNKIFTSDYGIHLSIGKHFIETGKVPHAEFLTYPILNQPMNFEELGFQAILYSVYRFVGSDGVSVFVWLMATLSFFFIYKSLRAREVNPWIALFTLLIFAMPFRVRLQPRPEIIAYFFTSFLIYGCSLFYYRGNRKIIWVFPFVFLLWSNIHPSTLAGFATIGAFGTRSLVVLYRDRLDKTSMKNNLYIPLAVLALCFLATLPSKHGFESVVTPLRLLANPQQTGQISEMTSIVNSGFYPYYKYIFALAVAFGLAGVISWKVQLHDVILAVYGLKLPLTVARGMGFMSIFIVFLVAVSFEGALRRIREYLEKREEASLKAAMKAAKGKESQKKKQGRKGGSAAGSKADLDQSTALAVPRRIRLPIALAWLVFLGSVGYGAWFIRSGTVDLVENGIGLTEHKFSLASGEFLRNLDIKGNMFNFFDLGGFIEWQTSPGKLTFIDGRAGTPTLFNEHQLVTAGAGDIENIFRKYGITYIVTKAVDSSGNVLPFMNYLNSSPGWELVFADGLALVFVKNVPENRQIIEKYRVPKSALGKQVVSELLHSAHMGVNKFYVYYMVASIYMNSRDLVNARKYLEMARSINDSPSLAALFDRLDGMARTR